MYFVYHDNLIRSVAIHVHRLYSLEARSRYQRIIGTADKLINLGHYYYMLVLRIRSHSRIYYYSIVIAIRYKFSSNGNQFRAFGESSFN